MSDQSTFLPTRTAGFERLQRFVPHAGTAYRQRRNYDLGPGRHDGVSTLSPYIRHRLVTETEVLQATLAQHSARSAEKFIQEVFWRTYWKGWLELRPAVWTEYQAGLARALDDVATQSGLRSDWEAACRGDTGLACFDAWAQELAATGYLHNHARMWFASIWIFTLRLPWELGADFFLRHLLDGDPASNTLSWRWVGGLQTRGKTYLARASNITKFTEGRFHPGHTLAPFAEALDGPPAPAIRPLPEPQSPDTTKRTGFLLHAEDLSPGHALHSVPEIASVAVLRAEGALSPLQLAPHLPAFLDGALADTTARYALDISATPTTAHAVVTWINEAGLEQVVTAYAPTGPVASVLDAVDAQSDVRLVRCRRAYDSRAWPHATHGFFRFKEKIPKLIDKIASPEAA